MGLQPRGGRTGRGSGTGLGREPAHPTRHTRTARQTSPGTTSAEGSGCLSQKQGPLPPWPCWPRQRRAQALGIPAQPAQEGSAHRRTGGHPIGDSCSSTSQSHRAKDSLRQGSR